MPNQGVAISSACSFSRPSPNSADHCTMAASRSLPATWSSSIRAWCGASLAEMARANGSRQAQPSPVPQA